MAFLIISIIIFVSVAILIPKRLRRNELYAIGIFSITIGFSVDIVFDLKYNFYGYFEPGVQFLGFLPILFLFSTAGVVFMNFYPYDKSIVMKLGYIFCWTVFCLIFEYFSLLSGYFYYNEWKLWYSALVYPFLFWLHLKHLKLYRKYTK